jgi:WD40 repeat protein
MVPTFLVCFLMMAGAILPLITPADGSSYKNFKVQKHLSGAKSGETVLWSPDGKYIVSQMSSEQQEPYSFKYWEVQMDWTWVEVPTEHAGKVYTFAWSPDSTKLATAYRSLIIFNIKDGWTPSTPLSVPGQEMIRTVDWHPTEARVALGTELGHLFIVNTDTMKIERTFNATDQWIDRVIWSPDGKMLAVSTVQGQINIYDTATWKVRWTLTGHTQSVKDMVWAPDGTQLVSVSFDSKIFLWDTTKGTFSRLIGGHGADVSLFTVKWNSKDNLLITGGSAYVVVWDAKTWDYLQKIGTGYNGMDVMANTLSWDPKGGRFVSSGTNGIDVWSDNIPETNDPWTNLTAYICGILLAVIIIGLGGYAAYQYYQRKKLEEEEETEEEGEKEDEGEEEEGGEEEEEESEDEEEEEDLDDEEARRQRRRDKRKGQRKKGW